MKSNKSNSNSNSSDSNHINTKEQLANTNSLIITLAAILSVIVILQLIYVY